MVQRLPCDYFSLIKTILNWITRFHYASTKENSVGSSCQNPDTLVTIWRAGRDRVPDEDRESRLFDELHQIRTELHALREDFAKRGMKEEFENRVNELEVEERLRQIQDEIEDANKPKKKKGWFH
jgi:sulfur transfer complex TusBCD TusB component (DsrH family)